MYSTKFMITIVDEFWTLYQTSIFCTCFLPFMIYFAATLQLFARDYTSRDWRATSAITPEMKLQYACEGTVVILTCYFFVFEVKQMTERGWRYLGEPKNLVELSSCLLNILLIVKVKFFDDEGWDLER